MLTKFKYVLSERTIQIVLLCLLRIKCIGTFCGVSSVVEFRYNTALLTKQNIFYEWKCFCFKTKFLVRKPD
jgi:hypothetical protein